MYLLPPILCFLLPLVLTAAILVATLKRATSLATGICSLLMIWLLIASGAGIHSALFPHRPSILTQQSGAATVPSPSAPASATGFLTCPPDCCNSPATTPAQ